jgi:DNA modification methylase
MAIFAGDRKTMDARTLGDSVPYRFVATATPSPNEFIELLAYAAFLGVMDVGQAKTRFFKRDSTKADVLTLHAHKEREFWLWVASWAIFVQKPSDLGHTDEGYELPPMEIHWHEIPDDHQSAGFNYFGQGLLLKEQALGVVESAREKRESLGNRIKKMQELRALNPDAHRIIWHDLEAERVAIEKAVPDVVSVYGAQDDDTKAERIIGFSEGRIRELAGKPVMLGSGCNFQRHCSWAIFLGIGFKFNDMIQAIHRLYRFLQTDRVRIDLIYTESEREVKRILETKWENHKETVQKMTEIIKEFGLSTAAMAETLQRAMGVERIEVSGRDFRIINNDCVAETANMPDNSVGLILTSIPFSTQYEYSPNYADFGHTDNNAHFFEQMDYLTPNLLRILKPGRIAAIHVKDRIVPGGLTGLGYQTVYPFHARCIEHYSRHGFGYMGMITIVTDVVRENNQTYRLGWTEVCKDGSKMSCGMPEYLLLFRKTPTDTSNAYADDPVVKTKDEYTRARWQTDAHAFWRSSGNRLMNPEELETLDHDVLFRWFRDYHLANMYDYEHHVKISETMDGHGRLPVTFMQFQPPSWMDDCWTDIARMRTLNMLQSQKGKEQHLCPMQFDIADRVIDRFSNKGDTVFDPFGGIMSVPYRALLKGRKALATELSPRYFMDGAHYLQAAENEMAMPGLFDTFQEVEAMKEAA